MTEANFYSCFSRPASTKRRGIMMHYIYTFKTSRPSLVHLDGKTCTIVRSLTPVTQKEQEYEIRVHNYASNGEYTEPRVRALYDELVLARA